MIEGKVLLYTTDKVYQAEILMKILADNNIKGFSINKKDSVYPIGSIEIYVEPDDMIPGKALVNKFEE